MSEETALPGVPADEAQGRRRRAESRHLMGASVIVLIASTLAKALGLLREAASAAIFGANRATDGFAVARMLPDMVSTWIEMPVRSAFVPLFTRTLHDKGEAEAWRVASNILNCLAVFVSGVVLLLVFGAPYLVRVFSKGFADEAVWIDSTNQARVVVISILFSVMATILASLLNVYRRQGLTSLGQIANGACVLAGVTLLGPQLGLQGFAIGILGGAAAAFLLQTQVVWRYRKHYRFVLAPRAPEVREMLVLALPLFIGLTGTRLDAIFDRLFASYLPAGHMSLLLVATMVALLAAELVLQVAQSVLLPHFAHLVNEKRFDELKSRLAQALEGYFLLILPMTAFLCGGALLLINLLLARGKFTPENAVLAATLLPLLALQAPAQGAGQIMAQVFISAGDTKTPMYVGFWRIGFKLILSIALLPWLGILGLAISTSASAWFRALLLWWKLPPEHRPDTRRMLQQGGRMVLLSLIAGFAIWGLQRLVPAAGISFVARIAATAGLGLLALGIGVGGALLLQVEVAQGLLRKLVRR